MSAINPGTGGNSQYPSFVFDGLTSTGVGALLVVGLVAVKAQIGASPLVGRKGIFLNTQSLNIHLGFSAAVNTVNGIELPNNTILYIPANETAEVWLIRTAAGGSCAVWEVA